MVGVFRCESVIRLSFHIFLRSLNFLIYSYSEFSLSRKAFKAFEFLLVVFSGFVVIGCHHKKSLNIFITPDVYCFLKLRFFDQFKALNCRAGNIVEIRLIIDRRLEVEKVFFKRNYSYQNTARFQNSSEFFKCTGRKNIQKSVAAFVRKRN